MNFFTISNCGITKKLAIVFKENMGDMRTPFANLKTSEGANLRSSTIKVERPSAHKKTNREIEDPLGVNL